MCVGRPTEILLHTIMNVDHHIIPRNCVCVRTCVRVCVCVSACVCDGFREVQQIVTIVCVYGSIAKPDSP